MKGSNCDYQALRMWAALNFSKALVTLASYLKDHRIIFCYGEWEDMEPWIIHSSVRCVLYNMDCRSPYFYLQKICHIRIYNLTLDMNTHQVTRNVAVNLIARRFTDCALGEYITSLDNCISWNVCKPVLVNRMFGKWHIVCKMKV